MTLEKENIPQRFKIDVHIKDIPEMLKLCYQHEVKKRGMNYNSNIEPYFERISRWLCEGGKVGLFMYGGVGSGKTTMMLAIKRLLEMLYIHKIGVGLISALELSDLARNDERKFETTKKTKFLAVDDFGCEPSTVKNYGNEVSPLTELLYYRYDNLLFTLITSNLDRRDIYFKYGERISSRMDEIFDFMAFTNKSYRQ